MVKAISLHFYKIKFIKNFFLNINKMIEPIYKSTFAGLHKWYVHVFEKFGWMILAKHEAQTSKSSELRNRMNHKIIGYKNMIVSLHEALYEKKSIYSENDRKIDLQNMITNVETLFSYLNKIHIISSKRKSPKRKSHKRKSHTRK